MIAELAESSDGSWTRLPEEHIRSRYSFGGVLEELGYTADEVAFSRDRVDELPWEIWELNAVCRPTD